MAIKLKRWSLGVMSPSCHVVYMHLSDEASGLSTSLDAIPNMLLRFSSL